MYDEQSETYSFSNPFFKVFCHCMVDEISSEKQLQINFNKSKELKTEMISKILNKKDYSNF
jgi:hypothetical protein